MININKFKGKIIEKGLNISELALRINMDKTTLYRKMNAPDTAFTIKEVDAIAQELSLTLDEVNNIFLHSFSHKCEKNKKRGRGNGKQRNIYSITNACSRRDENTTFTRCFN